MPKYKVKDILMDYESDGYYDVLEVNTDDMVTEYRIRPYDLSMGEGEWLPESSLRYIDRATKDKINLDYIKLSKIYKYITKGL